MAQSGFGTDVTVLAYRERLDKQIEEIAADGELTPS